MTLNFMIDILIEGNKTNNPKSEMNFFNSLSEVVCLSLIDCLKRDVECNR